MATKRKNPFCEEVPRQLKVHIGPKQVAGVEELKNVHDYTKYLLFKGSNPNASNEALQSVGCRNGFYRADPTPNESKENQIPKCHECSVISPLSVITCNDCDRPVCVQCIRQCCNCLRHFCSYCSILNYNQPEVRAFCLNCCQ